MTKLAFYMKGEGKSLVESKVLHKHRSPKSKLDIINLRCVASDGEEFINCDIEPDEAIMISNALTRAYLKWKFKDKKLIRK